MIAASSKKEVEVLLDSERLKSRRHGTQVNAVLSNMTFRCVYGSAMPLDTFAR
jgi:hypothetical protein